MTEQWTPEEQAEHRKTWVAALRSGQYNQAQGQLRNGDSYCCLGVACELSGLGEWDGDQTLPTYVANSSYSHSVLPEPIKRYYGLHNDSGSYKHIVPVDDDDYDHDLKPEENWYYDSLTELNDGGKTFAEIADIIETAPPGLLA